MKLCNNDLNDKLLRPSFVCSSLSGRVFITGITVLPCEDPASCILSQNQQMHKIINKYKMYLQPLHMLKYIDIYISIYI
jgi:hypothetical protein